MTPEEIVAEINSDNRATLFAREDTNRFTQDQVLSMMDAAAMRGFQFGSNVALSMVQGALVIQLSKIVSGTEKTLGLGDSRQARGR